MSEYPNMVNCTSDSSIQKDKEYGCVAFFLTPVQYYLFDDNAKAKEYLETHKDRVRDLKTKLCRLMIKDKAPRKSLSYPEIKEMEHD